MRSLTRDVQQHQLVVILAFALFSLLTLSILLWHITLDDRGQRLQTLARLLENVITQEELLPRVTALSAAKDTAELRALLEPRVRKVLEAFPLSFVGGFYSRSLDQVVAFHSQDPSVLLLGQTLPQDDPGRRTWATRRPQILLLFSQVRHAWILKCDNPVMVNGQVIGHTFANVPLSDLTALFGHTVLMLLVGIGLSVWASFFLGRKATRRIRDNANRLFLLCSEGSLPAFDYEEYDQIARKNLQTYNALKKAEKQKAAMLDHFPWGYMVTDAAGTYIDINTNGALILESRPELIIGQRAGSFLKDSPILKVLENHTPITTELTIPRPSGNKYVYISTFPLTLNSGEEGVMSWFIDMTEHQRMEAAVQHMERLSTVGELTAVIAHNIRNPLSTIKGIAQFSKLTADNPEVHRRWLQIDELVNQINGYLERILTFSRPGPGQVRPCSVRGMFDNIVAMLDAKLQNHRIVVETHVSTPEPVILVNQVDFQHVLLNLAVNACDAIDSFSEGGKLIFSAGWTGEGMVQLEITDTGCGIPEEDLPLIWDMFYTTKTHGTGIGLAMVKKVVEQAGGRIFAASTVGKGTTFTIILPPAESQASAAHG